MKLEDAKSLYPEEWIAFRAFEEGENPEGEVIFHNKNRRAFDEVLLEQRPHNVYITFTGPLIPERYAVMF